MFLISHIIAIIISYIICTQNLHFYTYFSFLMYLFCSTIEYSVRKKTLIYLKSQTL